MPLCDTLLRLAEDPAFYIPLWSVDILRELRSTLLKMGYTEAQTARRIDAMGSAFEDAMISGYQRIIPMMTNDPKDRHILAAAVHRDADAIITSNVRHFPRSSVARHDIVVFTPDAFLLHQFEIDQSLLREKLRVQASARGLALSGLLDRLEHHAPNCVRLLR